MEMVSRPGGGATVAVMTTAGRRSPLPTFRSEVGDLDWAGR